MAETAIAGGVSNTVTQDESGVYSLNTQEDATIVHSDNVSQQSTQKKQDPNYLDRRPAWIDTNTEYHRVKTANGISVDSAYIKRYYSVIDAEVYFGNEYVEDVCDINWSVRQNVAPLFGYNSYTYDDIARGNRLIVGNFLINFTSPNYLFSILKEADKANVTSITNMTSYTVPVLSQSGTPTIRKGTYGSREKGHHTHMWPQTFDIDIIFGEKTGAGDPVHILILGCVIQDCQMALSANVSGSPPVVMERYSFIAQDIRTVVEKDETESTSTNSVTSAQSNDNNLSSNDSLDNASVENTDFSSLSNLKVSNENKEMAKYYKEQQEKAKEKESVKQAINTAIANAKTQKNIDNINKNSSNFKVYSKQIDGKLLTYIRYTNNSAYDDGKDLSDSRTAVLLGRLDGLFGDNAKLTSSEQSELASKVKSAVSKGESFSYSDAEDNEYVAIPYTATYNGETKSGVALFDIDDKIINKLSNGTYYQKER